MSPERDAARERKWADLLVEAVNKPGSISQAFHTFHDYSIGNQLMALFQCLERGIAPGPIATFPRWKQLGRHVRRGEKALVLCMPITVRREVEKEDGSSEVEVFQRFTFRPNWFVLAQTEGEPYVPPALPTWDRETALAALGITEKEFDLMGGNTQGYAEGTELAINPLARDLFYKVLIHEAAHIVLGHTAEGGRIVDGKVLSRNLREAEAESVTLLVVESLGLGGEDESRGYIQHWWGAGNPIPDASCRRIFSAADKILRAGQGKAVEYRAAQKVEVVAA